MTTRLDGKGVVVMGASAGVSRAAELLATLVVPLGVVFAKKLTV